MPPEGLDDLTHLLREAVPTLGFHRVALGCATPSTTLRFWLMHQGAKAPPHVAARVVHRLSRWQEWVDGYREELEEVRRLRGKPDADLHRVVREVRHYLGARRAWLTEEQLALGCELPGALLEYWRLGGLRDRHGPLLLKALAHLRYAESWPVPQRGRGRVGF